MIEKEQLLSDKLNTHTFSFRTNQDKMFLVVLSDVHMGACNREYLKEIISFILSIKNCYVILGGDATNSTTATSKGNVLEEQLSGDEQIYAIVEDLKPLVENDRLIAIGETGNHGNRIYDNSYISINKMIAVLLGVPKLYKGNALFGFINVNNICYTVSVIHKNRKAKNYYEYARCDILYKEHWHELRYEQKLLYEWNKYNKSLSVIPTFEIYNGSFLNLPEYSLKANYRPQFIGTYFTLLDGKKRYIQPFIDKDLYYIINNGFKA